MKYKTVVKMLSRGCLALLTIALIAVMAVGQNLIIGGGTFTGSGQYYIKGNITNTASVTINGVVTLNGTAAQSIGTATKGAVNFQTLNVNTTGGSATMAVSTAVSSALSIAAGSTFDIQNNTLGVGGTSTRNGIGTLTTGATSTVNFTGTSAQTVLGGVAYNGDLGLSGAGTKTINAGVTVMKAFTHSGGDLTLTATGSCTLGTTASFAAVNNSGSIVGGSGLATFNNLLTQTNGGSVTSGSGNLSMLQGITNTNGNITVGPSRTMTVSGADFNHTAGTLSFDNSSTVIYGGGETKIAPATYGTLTLNTDAKFLPTGAATVNGTLNANSDITVSSTLAFATAANANISAGFMDNGTVTAPSGVGVVTFGGAGQTIAGSASPTFHNVTFAGTGAKTANTGINISSGGQLAVNQPLIMSGTNALTMKSGALQPSFTGQTEITGSMAWEASTAGTYIFNNSATNIAFAGTPANLTFTLNSQPGVYPTGYSGGHTVDRKYSVNYSNWTSGTANITLAYLQSEASGVTETKIKDFQNGLVSANKLSGIPIRQASGSGSFGYVAYTNLTSGQLLASNELGIDDRFNVFISKAVADWNVASTWDAGAVPGASDDVEIAGGYGVTISTAAAANSVQIDDGAAGGLILTGSGALTVGSGGITNGNATGAGLTVGTGTSVTVNSGTLTNNGAITNSGTIKVQ